MDRIVQPSMSVPAYASAPLTTTFGPRCQEVITALTHGSRGLHDQLTIGAVDRSVPGPLHWPNIFAYSDVDAARAGFARHTNRAGDLTLHPETGSPYVRFGGPDHANLESKLLLAHRVDPVARDYGAVVTGAGMAAIFASIIRTTKPGDHIILDEDLYGCSKRLAKILERDYARQVTVMNIQDTEAGYEELKKAIKSNTTAIYAEVQTNPHMKLNNVVEITRVAYRTNQKERRNEDTKIRVIFDNTFLGPVFCRPLELIWVDQEIEDKKIALVVESMTKIIDGFGLSMGGGVIAPKDLIHDEHWEDRGLRAIRDTAGLVLHPLGAYMLSNLSMPTLVERAKYMEQVAQRFARFLEDVRGRWVSEVTYPGLASYTQSELAARQILDYDGVPSTGFMVGFGFMGTPAEQEQRAVKYMNYLARFGYAWVFAVSLGQIRSLTEVPAAMTHYGMGLNMFARNSVGQEAPADIIGEAIEAFEYAYAA